MSPASNYREELVTGPGGLLSRGLLAQHTTSYGALPPTNQQRTILAGILNDYVRANFPEHVQSHSGAGIVGVPGFWQELSGMVHIWKPHNYPMPLLVITDCKAEERQFPKLVEPPFGLSFDLAPRSKNISRSRFGQNWRRNQAMGGERLSADLASSVSESRRPDISRNG